MVSPPGWRSRPIGYARRDSTAPSDAEVQGKLNEPLLEVTGIEQVAAANKINVDQEKAAATQRLAGQRAQPILTDAPNTPLLARQPLSRGGLLLLHVVLVGGGGPVDRSPRAAASLPCRADRELSGWLACSRC